MNTLPDEVKEKAIEYVRKVYNYHYIENDSNCMNMVDGFIAGAIWLSKEYAKAYAPAPDSKTEEYYNNLTKKLGTYTDYQYTGPRCVAGCKRYTAYETYHHKDCPYYPNSFSERFDKLAAPVPGKEEIKVVRDIQYWLQKYNHILTNQRYRTSQHIIEIIEEMMSHYLHIEFSPSTASNEDKGYVITGGHFVKQDHWAGSPETNPALNPEPKAVQQAAKEMDVVAIEKIYDAFANWYHDDGGYDTFLRSEAWKAVQEYISGISFKFDEWMASNTVATQESYTQFLKNKNSIQQAHDKAQYE